MRKKRPQQRQPQHRKGLFGGGGIGRNGRPY